MKLDHSIDIQVASEVYNPSDDSFLILKITEASPGQKLLDMGTGSGIVALHAAKAGAVVTAVDINPNAVQCARSNALRNDLKMDAIESDLFEKVPGLFDVIVFNPPYLPDEDGPPSWMEKAWAGGGDGSDVIIGFLDHAWRHLSPKGEIYMILSSIGGLRSILRAAKERYEMEMIEEKHMFFESIFAYRLVQKIGSH